MSKIVGWDSIETTRGVHPAPVRTPEQDVEQLLDNEIIEVDCDPVDPEPSYSDDESYDDDVELDDLDPEEDYIEEDPDLATIDIDIPLGCENDFVDAEPETEDSTELAPTPASAPAPVDVVQEALPVEPSRNERIYQAITNMALSCSEWGHECDISRTSRELVQAMINSTPHEDLDFFSLLEATQVVVFRQQSMTSTWSHVDSPQLRLLIDFIQRNSF
ncbi:MAG: hypothetical protein Q4B77_05260 [Coriobacteriaceae bacterium]|nr:hypothetical protein [Coriobacteriaceae bacterium]